MIHVLNLSLEDARLAISVCKKKAVEIGVPMDIAVVDASGNFVAFERMDGAIVGCIQIAIDKAYTAAVLGLRTEEEGKLAQPGGPEYGINTAGGGRLILLAGGIPVRFGKAVIGAVGCSSGTVDQDATVALAGVEAIEERLQKVGAD